MTAAVLVATQSSGIAAALVLTGPALVVGAVALVWVVEQLESALRRWRGR